MAKACRTLELIASDANSRESVVGRPDSTALSAIFLIQRVSLTLPSRQGQPLPVRLIARLII